MERITDVPQLLDLLDEGLRVRGGDIAAGEALLSKFYYSPAPEITVAINEHPPGSQAQYERQMELIYEPIAGRKHSLDCEGHDTPAADIGTAFPFNMPPRDAAYWTVCYARLIEKMNLPRGARVLEIGFGPGGLTELMARTGLDVTAIEVRESNCAFVRQRVETFGGTVATICGDIDTINLDGEFDAIIFFESFHHMKAPKDLLKRLRLSLTDTGIFVFGAEPIVNDDDPLVPFPWGFRMDGAALSALRLVGWVEFGFQASFFQQLLQDVGFTLETIPLEHYHHGTVRIARPNHQALARDLRSEVRTLMRNGAR